MRAIEWPDGTSTPVYEVGDIVELTRDQRITGDAGEWGRIYEVDRAGSISIQLAGYSRPEGSLFAAATGVMPWEVKPRARVAVTACRHGGFLTEETCATCLAEAEERAEHAPFAAEPRQVGMDDIDLEANPQVGLPRPQVR